MGIYEKVISIGDPESSVSRINILFSHCFFFSKISSAHVESDHIDLILRGP